MNVNYRHHSSQPQYDDALAHNLSAHDMRHVVTANQNQHREDKRWSEGKRSWFRWL